MTRGALFLWATQASFYAAIAILWAGCHGDATSTTSGTETNWLRRCAGPSDCPDADCLCGVCTGACSRDTACMALADDARCAPSGTEASLALCGADSSTSLCLPTCTKDSDCGTEFRCMDGFCAGTSSEGEGGFGGVGPSSGEREPASGGAAATGASPSGGHEAASGGAADAGESSSGGSELTSGGAAGAGRSSLGGGEPTSGGAADAGKSSGGGSGGLGPESVAGSAGSSLSPAYTLGGCPAGVSCPEVAPTEGDPCPQAPDACCLYQGQSIGIFGCYCVNETWTCNPSCSCTG